VADTYTPNLNLTKPEVGASRDTWGGKTNGDWDIVDAIFAAAGSGTSVGLNVGSGKTLTVAGTQNVTGTFKTDTVSEYTAAAGVTVDGVLLKDSGAVLGAGAVGTPSVTTTGDTNTGLYFPAADTLAATTGGTERLRIDSSGNVGIGTSSPESGFKLSVVGNAFVQNTSGQTVGKVVVDSVDNRLVLGSYFEAGIGQYSFISSTDNAETGNIPLLFRTGTTERMRIDASGNVGIGTSSPNLSGSSSALTVNTGTAGNFAALELASGGTLNLYINANNAASYIDSRGSRPLVFYTNGSERARIDSSGNVGIGTSSPLRVLHVVSNAAETQLLLRESDSSGPQLLMGADSAVSGSIINASSVSGSNSNLLLQTGGTERARIDSNGNVQINTTNAAATGTTCRFTIEDGTTYLPFGINNNAAGTGASNVALFARNGTTTGTISVTGTTTAYNTSSDYRLKHDVQPMLSGLSTIAALKPSTYKWNADNSYGEGFIAHELQAVIPQAVTGEKDAMNDDGSIKPQGVDYSKVVVHLVAAIQELKADFDAYKAAHP